MEEQVFMDQPGVTVTSTRVVLGNHTFATRNIGSVNVQPAPQSNAPYFICVLGGLLLLWGISSPREHAGALIVGLFLAGLAGWGLYKRKPLATLKIVAGGGEVVALASQPVETVRAIGRAIEQAIAVR